MRILMMAGLLALAAACTPPATEEAEQMSAGCDARAAAPWQAGDATYSVEATTTGPDCTRAVATIVLRNSSGAPVYAEAHLSKDVMVLAPARDPAAMQTALQEWVTYNNHTMTTTSALPDWPANASAPQNGEFPFYPEEGATRESYMALRQQNLPLFCYVQGMESMACLALSGADEVTKVGVQSFPG